MRAAGIDTASGAALAADRVPRGRDDLRRLPRRPARRQPASSCRTAASRCSTTASPAAWTSTQRLAFLRMMMTGAVNDIRGQLEAFRDLGALPPDADIDALMRVLKVDQPVQRPDQDDRRGAGARDPGRAEGPAQAGREAAEAPDALREEHDLLRRRDRAARAGRQSLRAGDAHLRLLRAAPRASASCATSASTRAAARSTSTACKRSLGLEDDVDVAHPARAGRAPRSASRSGSKPPESEPMAEQQASRAQVALQDIIRSGRPLAYIRSAEEARVTGLLRDAARSALATPLPFWIWSATEGMRRDGADGAGGVARRPGGARFRRRLRRSGALPLQGLPRGDP